MDILFNKNILVLILVTEVVSMMKTTSSRYYCYIVSGQWWCGHRVPVLWLPSQVVTGQLCLSHQEYQSISEVKLCHQ